MTSYENGVWTFASPDCPCCIAVRTTQGFPPVTPRREPTPASVERWAEWEASKPVFEPQSMADMMNWHSTPASLWFAEHPPPEQEMMDCCGEMCAPCAEQKALEAYYLSSLYLEWKASYDAFVSTLSIEPMTMTLNPELEAWLVSFPQPARSS